MKKYLIASHGRFASGLKNSIKVLTGKTDIIAIDAYLEEEPVDVEQKVKEFIRELGADDVGIIFTDLIGGSVNREVMIQVKDKNNIVLISSVNLPTVLAVILDTEPVTQVHLQEIIDSTPVKIIDFNLEQNNEDFLSDDEFLS
ncbi:PTS sugar transporter subunit IIA [Xylocopilactobacillus apis]|uniref:PTS mannose transporter subunit IIA n=1 Tax=Xylocopilactobacillus apis TaxID=2932183 RepID=A0AAU9CSX1_9LACO|nr:PTS sugar transporter subunit IIA [Xylocopilactobacillus apis]BDR55461.1 PTS mannose transporter subunit IIA [Xylocopilactobacillus apis]